MTERQKRMKMLESMIRKVVREEEDNYNTNSPERLLNLAKEVGLEGSDVITHKETYRAFHKYIVDMYVLSKKLDIPQKEKQIYKKIMDLYLKSNFYQLLRRL